MAKTPGPSIVQNAWYDKTSKTFLMPQASVRNSERELVLSPWDVKESPRDWSIKKKEIIDLKNPKIRKQYTNLSQRPLGGLMLYPAIDPYKPKQRALFHAIMNKLSWVRRANVIIQKLVCGQGYTSTIELRTDKEVKESFVRSWRRAPDIYVPYFDKKMSPNKIKSWVDKLADLLELETIYYNGYFYQREQGRCAIGMFPEERDPQSAKYVMPKVLKIIRPQFTLRPYMDINTGALAAVQIVGLTTNGGMLDANRCLYLNNAFNYDLFADYYGFSAVEPLEDIGTTLLTIYAQDFKQAAEYTWHQPKVFKVTVPARDWKNPAKVLDDFLARNNNSLGKDIAVTQNVELISNTTNSGDIAGVVAIQNECIDAIAGYYNIPPFMLAKGKAGRLGGNANREEIESFLEGEIRPEQIIMEGIIEKQFYDRVLAILFDIEPEEVYDPEKCPVRIRHHMNKPDIALLADKQQYDILMDAAHQGLGISKEMIIEKMGWRKLIKEHETEGELDDPTVVTWKKINPSWKPMQKLKGSNAWKPKPSLNKSANLWIQDPRQSTNSSSGNWEK